MKIEGLMKENTKKSKKNKVGIFNWIIWFYILVLIISVMAFGLIGVLEYDMDEDNALYMIAMIPLMGIGVGIMLYKINNTLKLRMQKILDGISDVAEGNLDVELDLYKSGEYKIIYQNFNKMVTELRNTKIEMQNFVNDFSHEFKTPITSIKGFAELILETDISEEERKLYLHIIAEESSRLAELSQNTLLLSKLDAEEVVVDKKEFSLDEQIKKCTIMLFRELEKKQIVLNMELPCIRYYGNEELICQIWMNLISNAIKFTPEYGEVSIVMISDSQNIIVDITDSGIGVDEDTIKHIFEKYYQGDPSHATKGYGLGLSIVERIVTLCDGKISVTSSLGSGSTFKVILPIIKL